MARRSNPYEWAIERRLIGLGLPYVPVGETNMALVDRRAMKNFDFIVYRKTGPHWLLEVKGRKVSGAGKVNAWVTKSDLAYLGGWRGLFGAEFAPVFGFIFRLPERDAELAHFVCDGLPYEAWVVGLDTMQRLSYERSRSWGTMTLGAADFRRVATPLFDGATGEDTARLSLNAGPSAC